MYDRHNPIIKWYQYDHTKLYKTAESEESTQETGDGSAAETAGTEQSSGSPTGDAAMDDEVARIMAQFADAKQNSVDDVFAAMAAENSADTNTDSSSTSPTGDPTMDDEVARIMAQFSGAKQNNVDDVFAMMAAEVNGTEEPGAGGSASADDDQEALLASILKPKQSTVDDLVAKAREGN